MEISTPTYTYKELTGATRLLENMRDNCIKKDTDTYDDPDRERKYKALSIAIDAIKKLPVTKRAMISQPMAGKTDEEIKATREKAIAALKEKGYTSARIRNEKLIGQATLQRLRHKQSVSFEVLAKLCELLECNIGDILEYTEEEQT